MAPITTLNVKNFHVSGPLIFVDGPPQRVFNLDNDDNCQLPCRALFWRESCGFEARLRNLMLKLRVQNNEIRRLYDLVVQI
jgi:hypothetical protein